MSHLLEVKNLKTYFPTRAGLVRAVVIVIVAGLDCSLLMGNRPIDALLINQAETWQRYTAADEEFSISLPELPAMATTKRPATDLDPERHERMLGAYANGVVYAIYSLGTRNLKMSFENFMATMAGTLPEGSLRFQRDITVDSVPGKLYNFKLNSQTFGMVQFHRTERHFYAIEAIGADAATNPEVTKYFSSLRFKQIAGGILVKDGPGANREVVIATASAKVDDRAPAVFNSKDVDRKPIIVIKPTPAFSALAEKNHVAGTIVLRAEFSATGRITRVFVKQRLPDGLTENAIEAAKQIRFVPAIKNGRFVSMWMELQYNFIDPLAR